MARAVLKLSLKTLYSEMWSKTANTILLYSVLFSAIFKSIIIECFGMTRAEIKQHNKKVVKQVRELIKLKLSTPYYCKMRMGYKELASRLNANSLLSSRGNRWTFRSLYRMMQRQNISLSKLERRIRKKGIYVLVRRYNYRAFQTTVNGHLPTR